jgi:hypothetical protein
LRYQQSRATRSGGALGGQTGGFFRPRIVRGGLSGEAGTVTAQCGEQLQYAMRDRLSALGWSQIDTVDDDLGRSAAGGIVRAGFERMVAEVCLGKVGAVAAREVSRFARNSRDWQQLIEVCRVVDLAD